MRNPFQDAALAWPLLRRRLWRRPIRPRPIRVMLPYPPGGGSDTIARPLARRS